MTGDRKHFTESAQRWKFASWLAVTAIAAFALFAGVATNLEYSQFFSTTPFGTLHYADLWKKLLSGTVVIDPVYLNGEYYITGKGETVSYFGVMPVIFRAIASPFADIFKVGLSNLSVILAIFTALGSVGYTIWRLGGFSRSVWPFAFLLAAIAFSSPLYYMLAWTWIYHECAAWGAAWAIVALCGYLLWSIGEIRNWRIALTIGGAAGLSLLSRPSVALMALAPFGFLVTVSCLEAVREKSGKKIKTLLPALAALALACALAMALNYARWGNPFTFVKVERNHQILGWDLINSRFPGSADTARSKGMSDAGYFNAGRVPYSLRYYTSVDNNFMSAFPFVKMDEELAMMKNAPHFDVIEGSRLPVELSMPYLVFGAVFGLWAIFRKRGALAKNPFIIAALVTGALSVYNFLAFMTVAFRYQADILPFIVFLNIFAALQLADAKFSGSWKWKTGFGALLLISIAVSVPVMVGYKLFVCNMPMEQRQEIARRWNFPKPYKFNCIINSQRVIEY